MKLYYTPGACSLAVHITALEAKLPVDIVRVALPDHKTETGQDYYEINPMGYVPLLQLDDGTKLTEVASLVQYLGDLAPKSGLIAPAGTVERVKITSAVAFVATELHKVIGPLWAPNLTADQRQVLLDRLDVRLGHFATMLGDRDWLVGDRFTIADAYAFAILNWTNFLKLDISAHPKARSYISRVAARPAVQAAMKAEGLLG